MPLPEDLSFNPKSFCGQVRLFPLPNLVMFPHVIQPLHIFEPRYRELLQDALASDKLIGMALLADGGETKSAGRPGLHPVACLGRIATHHQLEDGRSNLLLLGLRRIRILEELPPRRLYREARVELLADQYNPASASRRAAMQSRLLAMFKNSLAKLPHSQEQLDHLLGSELPLGMLTDIVAYTLDVELAFKARMLVELNADRRAELLLERLERPLQCSVNSPHASETARPYPPQFSLN